MVLFVVRWQKSGDGVATGRVGTCPSHGCVVTIDVPSTGMFIFARAVINYALKKFIGRPSPKDPAVIYLLFICYLSFLIGIRGKYESWCGLRCIEFVTSCRPIQPPRTKVRATGAVLDCRKIFSPEFMHPTRVAAYWKNSWKQYALAFGVFVLVSLFNFWVQHWIGHQAIALIYLFSVVLVALFVNRGATFYGTVLTAAGWNYIFAPPVFAFNISDAYDDMMLMTYFIVTLIVGQLTTRLRTHREAEMQAKLTAESERLGRTLLNSVSHELRTPISAIASAAHSLHAKRTFAFDEENLLYEIEAASDRLNRVVQGLLSAARIQSGQVAPKPDWCDISDLVNVTLYDLSRQVTEHTVKTDLPPDLPLVKVDFVLTQQALGNLIVNAVTHTPPKTLIEISARVDSGFLILSVADAGPGLPPDQLDRIFDSFYRAAHKNRRHWSGPCDCQRFCRDSGWICQGGKSKWWRCCVHHSPECHR